MSKTSSPVTSVKQVSESCIELLHTEVVEHVVNHPKYKDNADRIYLTLEQMGYNVGVRLAERSTKNRPRFSDQMYSLEVIKFICKEFWIDNFQKQIDNLKTNHRGTFVLHDSKFRYLANISGSSTGNTNQLAHQYVIFTVGMIRGALSALNVDAIVTAEPKPPGCLFKIQEKA